MSLLEFSGKDSGGMAEADFSTFARVLLAVLAIF